ncbi:MAG: [FeFe] hydrogenase H-cluster radical SAM maturase HydE [Sphingobacteriia bacterium]|nr:[FeFe] hydrogenase H-cluster radical SAM maturase HydE [Sphingobacteriia bacterium]
MQFAQILNQSTFSTDDLVKFLAAEGEDRKLLFAHSAAIKQKYVQDLVYFRGLIEFSNICAKNCYYCGIRKSNPNVIRYNLTDDEIVGAAKFALDSRYGSIVLQSGELRSKAFIRRITKLLDKIHQVTNNRLRITLSCGEQARDTFREWMEHGAIRYLLRIETTNRELYYKIHPQNQLHSFDYRLQSLYELKDTGYQVGTGVMIGLPFQTLEDLAKDLLWMQSFDIDMVGMGPYLEHAETPLYAYRHLLLPMAKRFDLSLKMIAALRILMKDINIASATALQSIEKMGREKAIMIGANVIMPNITPCTYRDYYKLYDNKPCTAENPEDCKSCLEMRIKLASNQIAWDEWGDSLHWLEK